jgi:hypothetical protein
MDNRAEKKVISFLLWNLSTANITIKILHAMLSVHKELREPSDSGLVRNSLT